MSVYSGFATRQQEQFYFKLLERAVQMMSTRLVSFFNGGKQIIIDNKIKEMLIDDKAWAKKIRKIHKFLESCDTVKHLPPRFARSMQSLADYINHTYVNLILFKLCRVRALMCLKALSPPF
jgi:hypothetical protein